ncbi:hypothetical protein GQX73_g10421 [Xylaria multiplex]|uniref:Uncharacterized protein n=1 Tax=Xylaria multiplex TaxID=323545 RepID=A0A7C8MFE7_9PEZI|nr:hypothetical protein GQX73_g10421 [Xylaria multiplex]
MTQEFYHLNGPRPGPVPPQQQAPLGGYPQGHSAVPPPPPRNMIPMDLRGGSAVEISDISQDFFSESDIRNNLTNYAVFRFEKMVDSDGFDDYGKPKRPSWVKAIRTEDRSISKQMVAKKIRQLNFTTRDAIDKKNTLPPELKAQIDSTLELLMRREADVERYHWNLAQMDHQLRAIEPYYFGVAYQSIPSRKNRSSATYNFPSKRRSHSGSGSHRTKKAYERISLTAYFQRVPRPEVDVRRLWNEKRKRVEGIQHPHLGGIRNVVPQVQPNNPQLQGQQNGGRPQAPPPMQMPNRNPQGPQGPQQNKPINQDAHKHTGDQGHPQNRRKGRRFSDSESDSGNDSRSSRGSLSTRLSSVSEGKGYHNNHHHAGNSTNHLHNHPPKNERPIHKVNERVKEEAFISGRIAENRFAEELAFEKAHHGRSYPRVIQEYSPPRERIYRVRNDEGDIPRTFNRLSLVEDEDEDVRFRLKNARQREYEHRVRHGSILEGDPFEDPPSPSSYTYSVDSRERGRRRGIHTMEVPERHLSPRPRRRVSYVS